MIKVLAIAPFDPASVVLSHRDALRAHCSDEIDFRIALHRSIVPAHDRADYYDERFESYSRGIVKTERGLLSEEEREELIEFAKSADILQWHPGLGIGGSDVGVWNPERDAPYMNYLSINWDEMIDAMSPQSGNRANVALFHGSTQTWHNRKEMCEFYSSVGCDLAATTLDYAFEMGHAEYLPPCFDYGGLALAPLRELGDPFVIVHSPTDQRIASTQEFLKAATKMQAVVKLVTQVPHSDVMAAKSLSHATFDHMRGSFSVNSVEAMALGTIPVFKMEQKYNFLELGKAFCPFGFSYSTLEEVLELYVEDAPFVRAQQLLARRWWEENLSSEVVAKKRLLPFYKKVLGVK